MDKTSGDNSRAKEFRRNGELESLLGDLNACLAPAESAALARLAAEGNSHPIVFVMGPHRSGSTLFLQWLASCGIFAYPTNLLSRFYGAPVVGAMIQLLLTDRRYNFRNEILDFNAEINYLSENGKTTGALSPNEFWYFWRRFLPFKDLDWLPDDELFRTVDTGLLVSELSTLTSIFNKPFALKGMILNYNIPFLDRIFERALFIQMYRDPVANVASALDARRRQYGDESVWYSFRIPEYPELQGLGAIEQTAGQIACINRAVSLGLAGVEDSRKLFVGYEEFCRDPAGVYEKLMTKMAIPLASVPYHGARRFQASAPPASDTAREIANALARFQAK